MIYLRRSAPIIPATVTLVDSTQRAGSGANVTDIACGPAAFDRMMVVYCLTNDAVTTAATLNGVAALPIQLDIGANRMLLAVAPMPTGTTATLTLTGATPLYTFGAVALTGVTPTYYAVAGALANSVTIDTPANGALVAASIKAPTGTVAWGGGLTEDFDYSAVSGAVGVSMAHLVPAAEVSGLTVTATGASVVMAISFSRMF